MAAQCRLQDVKLGLVLNKPVYNSCSCNNYLKNDISFFYQGSRVEFEVH